MTRAMEDSDDTVMELCDDKNSGALWRQGPWCIVMTWSWNIVMTRILEHCDDTVMEHCDDKNSGAV